MNSSWNSSTVITNRDRVVFIDENINITKIDYYYTNAISRSSKTMADCKNINKVPLKNGTNN